MLPEAKVVLTVRDPERRYASVMDTIYKIQLRPPFLLWFIPPMLRFIRMADATTWHRLFPDGLADRAYAIEQFEAHIAEVKQFVPAEKLLVFSVKEGWQPLCAFLDVPVPDTPFPHVNDRAEMKRRIQLTLILPWVVILSIAGILIYLLTLIF